jgi:hypothetical protein
MVHEKHMLGLPVAKEGHTQIVTLEVSNRSEHRRAELLELFSRCFAKHFTCHSPLKSHSNPVT